MKKMLCVFLFLILVLPCLSFAESSPISEGDTVIFGRYEQDGDPDNGPEPLQWLVLEADDDMLLLITQYEVAYRPYSVMQDQMVSWADSDLRAWLNDSFLTYAFTGEERAAIAETPLHTPGSTREIMRMGKKIEMTAPECDTADRVFVLSSEETERCFYFGTTEADAASEHRLSMPAYGVLIRLALDGATSWETVREIPGADDYARLANRLLPVAKKTEEGWTLPMPSVREYSQFWKDLQEFSPLEMWPWLLREQGMTYDCYWDGNGCTGFYDGYCWRPTCVRPAVRVSRTALEHGMIIRPAPVYPLPADPKLSGVWKAETDGQTVYWNFNEDGYHSTMSIRESGTLFTVSLLYQAGKKPLILAQIGTQGELFEGTYKIDGDTLILKIAKQEVTLERVDAEEWAQITE